MKGRAQTQPVIIPENASRDYRATMIRVNQNFVLLDKKIEQLWKKLEELQDAEGGDESV